MAMSVVDKPVMRMVHVVRSVVVNQMGVAVHLHPSVVMEYHLAGIAPTSLSYYTPALCAGIYTYGHHYHKCQKQDKDHCHYQLEPHHILLNRSPGVLYI